jgi:Tol biopolymer transport system component
MRNPLKLALLAGCIFILMMGSGAIAQEQGYTIYFQSDREGDTAVYSLEGDEAVRVSELKSEHPSVTADGSLLFYTRFVDTSWGKFWNVFYFRNGQEEKLSTNEIIDEFEPVVSRDGTVAAFTTRRDSNLEIITVPIIEEHGLNELDHRITANVKPDEQPALATGDQWVYWTGRTGNHSYIFRAPGGGGGDVERISEEGMVWQEHPSVSADNRYVVYAAVVADETPEPGSETTESAREPSGMGEDATEGEEGVVENVVEEGLDIQRPEGNSDIYILDRTTGERTRLTSDPSWEGNPCISADGRKIVFTSDRDGNNEIYIMNRDGSGLERLTNSEADDDFAAIS